MIINLNKLTHIKDIVMDLTNMSPAVYFLFNINENTPRYKRINGQYVLDPNGSYIIDHGVDIFDKVPRVLKYIGEAIHGGYRRLSDHYTFTSGKTGKHKAGIGPIFTHVRMIKNYKILDYDSTRIHLETLLVRKFLPQENSAAQLTKNQILIILNSEGKITPYDFIVPNKINFKDIFQAYQAWLIEDTDYIKENFAHYEVKNKAGIIKNNPQSYRRKGVKLIFSKWFQKICSRFHKKQYDAYVSFAKRQHELIKEYDPLRYERLLKNNKIRKQDEQYKERSRLYSKMYRENKKQKNQPELL